jgi:RNA polymerase sigma-70 factor (ECF subfamily)
MINFDLSLGFAARIRRVNFEQQIQSHLTKLYRIARGIVDQASDAEDLVHDTCVKALTSFDTAEFSSEAQLRGWLNRILINTYRDNYRRARRSPVRPLKYHASSDDRQNVVELVPSTGHTPLDSIEHRDSSRAIKHAVAALPPEVRVVSVLFLVNGLSYKDIAFVTNCPVGTVMSRMSRGRELLKQHLADYDLTATDHTTSYASGGDEP